MNRFFRCFDDNSYEQARLSLDSAWNHPTPDGRTITCIDPASVAPRDENGHIMVAINADKCEWPEVANMIGALINAGIGEEITREQYDANAKTLPLP